MSEPPVTPSSPAIDPATGLNDVDWRHPWLAARAARDPDRVAIVIEGRETTFCQLDARARVLAHALRRRGLECGARVASLTGSTEHFVQLVHACQYAGLVIAPLNGRLTPAELDVQIRRLEPALMVHDAANAQLADRAARSLERGCVLDLAFLAGAEGAAAVATSRLEDLTARELDLDAVATIVFTSGTASAPKGVMLSAAAHLASARGVLANLGVTPADRWLVPLPLYHVGGLAVVYRSVLAGFSVVLDDATALRPGRRAASSHPPTIASLVPTMLARVLGTPNTRGGDAPRSPTVVLGGGPCSPDLLERAAAAGIAVVTSYGMTETASQVTATAPGQARAASVSAGRPLSGVEIRIAGADTDGVGEILVRAPQLMLGYLADAAATQRALRDGWLHTGDIGRLSDDGSLAVATRREDLIVSGGENVVPEEVELVLVSHPSVAEAAVFGCADEEWGQRVAATVVEVAGVRADAAELERWCRERLAGYKVPRSFEVASDLPRTAGGKIRRSVLAAAAGERASTPSGRTR